MPSDDRDDPYSWPEPADSGSSGDGDDPLFEKPLDKLIEPDSEPLYEVVETVKCWRCGLSDTPARGRCRKCNARIADEEPEPRPRSRRSRRSRPSAASEPRDSFIGFVILCYSLFLAV